MPQGFVTSVRKGTSEKSGRKYHVLEIVTQDEETGDIGLLKQFLDEFQQGEQKWQEVKVGTVLDLELEERKDGLNTYTNIASAEPDHKAKVDIHIS